MTCDPSYCLHKYTEKASSHIFHQLFHRHLAPLWVCVYVYKLNFFVEFHEHVPPVSKTPTWKMKIHTRVSSNWNPWTVSILMSLWHLKHMVANKRYMTCAVFFWQRPNAVRRTQIRKQFQEEIKRWHLKKYPALKMFTRHICPTAAAQNKYIRIKIKIIFL